jgi:hypothetical protein
VVPGAAILAGPTAVVLEPDGSLARVDVAYPELKPAVEYGAWHRRAADWDRAATAEPPQRSGVVVLFVTAAEMKDRLGLSTRLDAAMGG